MRRVLAICALCLSACPICPDPQMDVVTGSVDVGPGEIVQLRARYGDWEQGPGACGGHWSVNGVENGDLTIGVIDSCGRYQAPAAFPAELDRLDILASKYGDGCADCCPFAVTTLRPRR